MVLGVLNDALSGAVGRSGNATSGTGTALPTEPNSCAALDAVIGALRQQADSRPTDPVYVVLDSPSFTMLLRRERDLTDRLGLHVMNVRLFTRPLHVFQNDAAIAKHSTSPNVGVFADQEITAPALRTLLRTLLNKPVDVVPFQNVAVMARCLKDGEFDASYSKCPASIGWAAIVEQDASLTVEVFRQEYEKLTKSPPKPFPTDDLQLGAHVESNGTGIELVVSRADAVRTIGASAAAGNTGFVATVPRTSGAALIDQQARDKPPAQTSLFATLWASLPSFGTTALAAADDVDPAYLRYPYPIVLTNQSQPDERLRSALSDSYMRALNNGSIGSPCSGVAERLHRAFLFNAHLEDPADASKTLGLGTELVTATRGNTQTVKELFERLKLSPNPKDWAKSAGAVNDKKLCPNLPNQRFPLDRLVYANASLTFQYYAMEHLRRGNLDAAAGCLRNALANSDAPSCHRMERSTYSFYYNPYFYFAVQQASGGRPPR